VSPKTASDLLRRQLRELALKVIHCVEGRDHLATCVGQTRQIAAWNFLLILKHKQGVELDKSKPVFQDDCGQSSFVP
jgi:hypothetical protein